MTAILILVIFILSPALLLLCYPTKLFRKCSSYCRLRRWQALHVFAETFQGCYKDGVNGTKDFRSLAGLYLVVRIALLTSGDVETNSSLALGWLLRIMVTMATAFLITVTSRYNHNPHYNTIVATLITVVSH